MSDANEVKLCLKVFINKEKTKVLFAEAGNDFADVLLSFLGLPLGKIVKILKKEYGGNAPAIGSLTTLYSSLSNLNMVDLWTEHGKQVLNNPRSWIELNKLKVSVDYALPSTYRLGEPYNEFFTRNSASFLISDDLLIVPNLTGSIIETLSILGIDITDTHGAETRNVTIGLKEVLELLKGSLTSHTPLSDLILNTRQTKLAGIKYESGISLHPVREEASSNAEKMALKVMFQKSTNKLLFAQTKDDFVNFLFCMLNAFMGRVERVLGGNTCLTNIDNLNRSLANHIDHVDKFFSKNRFSATEEVYNLCSLRNFLSPSNSNHVNVEESRMYMVTDNLTVTHSSLSSILSLLDHMKISVADVEEVELQIGYQEALSILKASLTSTCALTDGLINSYLKKLPMQIQKIMNQRQRDKALEEKERVSKKESN